MHRVDTDDGLSAACANMGRDGLCLIPEDVGNHDLGPFRREEPHFGLAHPVRAAGNDRDFVFERMICSSLR
jgi:hypothetical protein